MTYTRKQAIEDCLKLWSKLADPKVVRAVVNRAGAHKITPYLLKREVARSTFETELASDCPCCEYVQGLTGCPSICSRVSGYPGVRSHALEALNTCPLKTLWPGGCRTPESPYSRWGNLVDCPWNCLDIEAVCKTANEIVNHCKELLSHEEESS